MRKSIITFHLNQIGDMLFSFPALYALKQSGEFKITAVVRPNCFDLLRDSGLADSILVRKKGPGEKIRLVREMRRAKPDIALSFSQSSECIILAFLSNAKERMGFNGSDFGFLLNRRIEKIGPPSMNNFNRLLEETGVKLEKKDYTGLAIASIESRAYISEHLTSNGVTESDKIIVLAPFASNKRSLKEYPDGRLSQICKALLKDAKIIITGAPNCKQKADEFISLTKGNVIDFVGKTSISQMAALLERANLFLGIDSGTMHLAASVGTPVVVIFGPTDPSHTAPQGKIQRIIRSDTGCNPCTRRSCTNMACFLTINPEDILDACRELMKE